MCCIREEAHAVAGGFLADDEEQEDGRRGDGGGGQEVLDGDDLRCYACFGVDGAAAGDLGVGGYGLGVGGGYVVGDVGGDDVDVGG